MLPKCSIGSEEVRAQEDQCQTLCHKALGWEALTQSLCRGEQQGRAPRQGMSEGIQGFIKLLTLLHSAGIHTRMYKTKY